VARRVGDDEASEDRGSLAIAVGDFDHSAVDGDAPVESRSERVQEPVDSCAGTR
jgi:hypothetical protein